MQDNLIDNNSVINKKFSIFKPCILLGNQFNPDSYKTRLDCYTFQIASFCKNNDCRKKNLLGSRFVLKSAWNKKKIVEKNQNNLKRHQQPYCIYYADTALNVLLRLKSKQSGFTIQIKRISQTSNTRWIYEYIGVNWKIELMSWMNEWKSEWIII